MASQAGIFGGFLLGVASSVVASFIWVWLEPIVPTPTRKAPSEVREVPQTRLTVEPIAMSASIPVHTTTRKNEPDKLKAFVGSGVLASFVVGFFWTIWKMNRWSFKKLHWGWWLPVAAISVVVGFAMGLIMVPGAIWIVHKIFYVIHALIEKSREERRSKLALEGLYG